MRRGRGPGEASPRPDAGWEAAVAAQGGGEDLDDAEPLHGSEAAKEGGPLLRGSSAAKELPQVRIRSSMRSEKSAPTYSDLCLVCLVLF